MFEACCDAGDDGPVIIGSSTNLQDAVVIRTVPTSPGGHSLGTQIGHKVTIGHGAQLHGCIIEDEVLIGMGATIFEGCHVSVLTPWHPTQPRLANATICTFTGHMLAAIEQRIQMSRGWNPC